MDQEDKYIEFRDGLGDVDPNGTDVLLRMAFDAGWLAAGGE